MVLGARGLQILYREVGDELAPRRRIAVPSHDREPSADTDDNATLAAENPGFFAPDTIADIYFWWLEELVNERFGHNDARNVI